MSRYATLQSKHALTLHEGAIHVVPFRFRAWVLYGALFVVSIGGFLWPLFFSNAVTVDAGHQNDAPWILLIMMPILIVLVISEVTSGRLDVKAVALLGVLTAVGSALRIPTGGIAGMEIVFFLFLPAGRVFGRGFGFVLGAVTLFVSALLTAGVGPWLPFQMLAAGWVGFGAGCLPRAKGKNELMLLIAYAIGASYFYGLLLDFWFWPFALQGETQLTFVPGDSALVNIQRFFTFHAVTSLGWDTMRAVSLTVMLLVLGKPVLMTLRRAAVRAAFAAPVVFTDSEVELEKT